MSRTMKSATRGRSGHPSRSPDDVAVEPSLHRSRVPVREPQTAVSIIAPVTGQSQDAVPATQGTLALALPWEAPALTRFETVTHPTGQLARRPVTPERKRNPHAAAVSSASLAPVPVLPEPKNWASTFVQAAMEVAVGLRPPGQMVRWTTPEIQETLARRGALVARAIRRSGLHLTKPAVRAVLICTPAPRICEATSVITDMERVRAVAFRMEGFQGRWRVTQLEIG